MIRPGIGSSAFKIGDLYDNLDLSGFDIYESEDRGVFVVYKMRSTWLFVLKKSKKIDQITFFYPFDEKVLDKVGIGDTLDDVIRNFGECVKIDGNYEPTGYPGISFETSKTEKKSAKIISISVSNPYAFYGELPDHIRRNSALTKGRKLP